MRSDRSRINWLSPYSQRGAEKGSANRGLIERLYVNTSDIANGLDHRACLWCGSLFSIIEAPSILRSIVVQKISSMVCPHVIVPDENNELFSVCSIVCALIRCLHNAERERKRTGIACYGTTTVFQSKSYCFIQLCGILIWCYCCLYFRRPSSSLTLGIIVNIETEFCFVFRSFLICMFLPAT